MPCVIMQYGAAHLINDGVTVDGDTVTVEWQGTGPSQANKNTQID